MVRVGLIAMGGSEWIAGVQYIHSLLLGNSLLAANERALLHLYFDPASHQISDYRDVQSLAAGVHVTDLSASGSGVICNKIRRMARTIVRQHSWPALPPSTLRRLLSKHRIDVLFAGVQVHQNMNIPQICWIPDFQHIHRQDFFSAAERTRRDQLFVQTIEKAERVIVSNQCSYDDAVRLYPEKSQKITVLPFTMSLGTEWRNGDPAQVVRKYALPEKFLLFPSQFWKHKNHLTVFRAIHRLRERASHDVILVCTGLPRDPRFPEYEIELQQYISEHRLTNAIRVLGLIARDEQVQLMRAAAAIIQASLFEGWSAIVEEGRSMGKKIFASDIPMHREQQTKDVYLFEPTSVEALVDLISRHWLRLQPGPQLEAEIDAEKDYYARIRKFAGQFVALSRSLLQAAR
jgi:glycosyltransferase involved in cell wall biosynthesis